MGLRKSNRPEALREVVEREPPRDAAGLLAQLAADDPAQRRWAARDLAAHAGAAAALGERLLLEPDASVREALFVSLATIGDDAAARALVPLLRSDDAGLRNGAFESLAGMPRALAGCLDPLLHDPDPDVRLLAVQLLGERQDLPTAPALLDVLHHEPLPNVVAAAIEVLAESGEPEHAPALREARRRFEGEPFIGFAVDHALRRIGSS